MNIELFDELMKVPPSQHSGEWKMFLEICEMYLKNHKIENPVVVELGTWRNRQKPFYEQLLGATHIGIDWSENRGRPDILGNTQNPETLEALKKKLDGRSINILFIDASHSYETVKKDYEIYSPLCTDIVTLHDIELGRHQNLKTREVYKFWDELKARVYHGIENYQDLIIFSLHKYKGTGDKSQPGLGMIIKR